jgi:hypothetical protein
VATPVDLKRDPVARLLARDQVAQLRLGRDLSTVGRDDDVAACRTRSTITAVEPTLRPAFAAALP